MAPATHKATILAMNPGEHPSEEYTLVEKWLEKWQDQVIVADYSSGGWEHMWNVSGSKQAIDAIPAKLRCASRWTNWK